MRRWWLVLVLGCALWPSMWAPLPAAAAEGAKPDLLAQDARLSKPVTLHGLGVPTRELLQKLSEASSVRLSCTEEVGEQRVVVLVDEVPARQVLEALVSLYGLNVRVSQLGSASSSNDKPRGSYRLVRSQANRELEKRLRDQELAPFKQRMEAWRQYGHLDDDTDKRVSFIAKHHDAFVYMEHAYAEGAADRSHRLGLFLEALTPDQIESLYRGERVTRRFSELPESLRTQIQPYALRWVSFQFPSMAEATRGLPGVPQRPPVPGYENLDHGLPPSVLSKARIVLWMDSELGGRERAMHVRLAGLDLKEAIEQEKVAGPFAGRHRVDMFFGGRSADGGLFAVPMDEVGGSAGKRTTAVGSPDPDLSIDLGHLGSSLGEGDSQREGRVLWQIHRVSRIPMLADYHLRLVGAFNQRQGTTLGDAVDWLQACANCTWRKVGSIHTFRDNTWYLDDTLEVPTANLKRWRDSARQAGHYSVGTICTMAQLTDTQLVRLSRYGLFPGIDWRGGDDAFVVIRLWGSLTEGQRATALGPGLDRATLTEQQLAIMEDGELIDADFTGSLRAESTPNGIVLIFPNGTASGLRRGVSLLSYALGEKRPNAPVEDLEWAGKHPETEKEGAAQAQGGVAKPPAGPAAGGVGVTPSQQSK
ncbi:MAG TPA: hypothetical protein VGN26_07575 [Armatimonadota bacterium]